MSGGTVTVAGVKPFFGTKRISVYLKGGVYTLMYDEFELVGEMQMRPAQGRLVD